MSFLKWLEHNAPFLATGPVGWAALGAKELIKHNPDTARSIPFVGPIAESAGLIGPSQEEQDLQQKLRDDAAQTQAYAPQIKAAQLETLRRQLGLYGPVNDMITKMYGPEFRFNLDGLASDPFKYDMQNGIPFNPQDNEPAKPVQVQIGPPPTK
jgi:hypothetical protein